MSTKRLDIVPIILTCIGGCLIGLAPIFVRFSEVGPSFTGFYRFLFATILIFAYGFFTKKIKYLSFRELAIISIPGLCFGTDIALWHSSIIFTSIAHATLFVNTAPLYVCILGYLLFKDKLNNLFLISLLISLLGVYVLVSNNPNFLGSYLSFGDLLALLAAFFYAGYLLSINKLSDKFNTFNLIFYSSLFACIPFGVASLFELDNAIPYSIFGSDFRTRFSHLWPFKNKTSTLFVAVTIPADYRNNFRSLFFFRDTINWATYRCYYSFIGYLPCGFK